MKVAVGNIQYSAWPYLAFCQVFAKHPAYLPPENRYAFYLLLLVGVFHLSWRSAYLKL